MGWHRPLRYQPANMLRAASSHAGKPEEAQDTGGSRPLRHGTEPHDIQRSNSQYRRPSCEFHQRPSHEGDTNNGARPLQPRRGPTTDKAAGGVQERTAQHRPSGWRRAGTHGASPTKRLEEGRSARRITDQSKETDEGGQERTAHHRQIYGQKMK
jgi:hypothetical protein